MNVQRIVLGGLLAGVFINVGEGILNAVILMDDWMSVHEMYGLTEASWAMVGYLGGGFVIGLAVAWLYAAIRPRFGAGPRTGAIAGVAIWVVAFAVPTIWFATIGLTVGAFGTTLALVWGVVEMVVAGMIAGWLYREEGDAAAAPAPAAAAPPAM